MFATEIRRKRVQRMRAFTHWRWHSDEVHVKINGEMHYLRRAVDQEGEVLEFFASKTRDKAAALTFMKLMTRHGRPKAITTDGLRSYKATIKDLGTLKSTRLAAVLIPGLRTPTSPSVDENGPC